MEDKAAYVQAMFAAIADRYDLLNHLLSFQRDRAWRKVAVSKCALQPGELVLDVATGTGEMALEMTEHGKVIGIDFCQKMLRQAKTKDASNVDFVLAMAECLPFPDNVFDCATIGFALRNVADIPKTMQEMVRVTKIGGRVTCLEFSQLSNRLSNRVYRFYLFHILPLI